MLDHLEHQLDAVPVLSMLVEECPKLTFLVTSRQPLGMTGEVVRPVAPLPVPRPRLRGLPELTAVPSVALFVECATLSSRRFALNAANATLVADICRRLDGLPLAIEPAAARSSSRSRRGRGCRATL